MTSKRFLEFIVAAVSLSCFAQDIQGPVTGWVYDAPTQAVRQISGMPGAARLGPAVLSDVEWASLAPSGNIAVVQIKGELRLFTVKDVAENTSGTPINGAIESPHFFAWAGDSSTVAVYSPASRSVQWIRINGQSATTDAAISLTGIDGDVTSIAADGISGLVAVAVAGSGVHRVSPDGTAPLVPVADASAIAVEPGGRTLWVADRTKAQVLEVTDLDASRAARVLTVDPERVADVSAIGLSPDRRQLYVADRSSMRLYTFDRSADTLAESIELTAPATAIAPLGRESVLLLGPRSQPMDPVYLLIVASAGPPAVLFVPEGEGK